MRRTIRGRWIALLAIMPVSSSAIFAGCGGAADELNRQAVVGTVKFLGEPLKAGMIQFQPSSPGVATAGGAGIIDGSYSIARAEGLVPGAYRVSITTSAALTQPVVGMPGDPLPPPKEPIPAKYNSQTKLNAEIKADAPNKFDFDLQAK